MNSEKTIALSNQFASHYDEYISKSNWYGPQMLFGLMYEYIHPEENLLDLGIGTGASSILFQKAGLKIYGVDGSEEMIKICEDKAITEDIRQANLEKFKSPYGVARFDHVISLGVFHLIKNLESIFSEVSRSIRTHGIFAFTIDEYIAEKKSDYIEVLEKGIYSKTNADSGIAVFKHSHAYIMHLIKQFNFSLILKTEFLAYRNKEIQGEYYFSVYLISRNNAS